MKKRNYFFRKEKLLNVQRLLSGVFTKERLSKDIGVSIKTLETWIKNYRDQTGWAKDWEIWNRDIFGYDGSRTPDVTEESAKPKGESK